MIKQVFFPICLSLLLHSAYAGTDSTDLLPIDSLPKTNGYILIQGQIPPPGFPNSDRDKVFTYKVPTQPCSVNTTAYSSVTMNEAYGYDCSHGGSGAGGSATNWSKAFGTTDALQYDNSTRSYILKYFDYVKSSGDPCEGANAGFNYIIMCMPN